MQKAFDILQTHEFTQNTAEIHLFTCSFNFKQTLRAKTAQ